MSYPVYYNGHIEVRPALSELHILLVEDVVNQRQNDETRDLFYALRASDEPDLPHYGGQLFVSEDGTKLTPEEGESRQGLRLRLVLLLKHFFGPNGYSLTGEISFEAINDPEDRGTIYTRGNQMETTDLLLFDPGPSWSPNHYAHPVLKDAVHDLLNSADSTGCTADLAVVSSGSLSKLREMISKTA